MPTDEVTETQEVIGSVAYLIHVDDSGEDPVRTAVSLSTKDDLDFSMEEDEETLDLSAERRTRRYRTNNTADLEVGQPYDVNLEAAALFGVVDVEDNGRITSGTGARRLRPEDDEYIEIAFFDEEGQDFADAELVHRFEDVETYNIELALGETPPIMSWTFMVHGDVYLAWEDPV